ncbi:MAG: helix-turn-helix domain-containing protein [Halanaerobiales bacterium]
MELSERIQKLRESRNIERKQLAIDLDVSYSSLSKYESGERTPDYHLIKKIACYFDVSIDYLLDHHPNNNLASIVADGKVLYSTVDMINKVAKLNDIDPRLIDLLIEISELGITPESLELIVKSFKLQKNHINEETTY